MEEGQEDESEPEEDVSESDSDADSELSELDCAEEDVLSHF